MFGRSIIISVVATSSRVNAATPNEYPPHDGCYYFSFDSDLFDVQAQIQVTSASTMNFELLFEADPSVGMPAKELSCVSETYVLEGSPPEAPQVVIGASKVSPCLKDLQDSFNNVVAFPLKLGYDAVTDSFNFTMVIDITMNRIEKCVPLLSNTGSTTSAVPSTVMTSTTTSRPTFVKSDENTSIVSNTTKHSFVRRPIGVLLIASAIAAMLM